MVTGIILLISGGTATILNGVLEGRLTTQLVVAEQRTSQAVSATDAATRSAADIVNSIRMPTGYMLVLESPLSGVSGAIVQSDFTPYILGASQIDAISSALQNQQRSGPVTVAIPRAGNYVITLTMIGTTTVAVGLPRSEIERTLTDMFTTVGLFTVGGLLLLIVVTTIVIRTGLRPLRAVADTATRVAELPLSEGDVHLSLRVAPQIADEPTEIGRVGSALNSLLDHVDASLSARAQNEQRMRNFIADASHELRTPLASIRGYSELSLRNPALAPDTETALERIQAQSIRMTSLVEDLLLLTRLDENRELNLSSIPLAGLIYDSVADARAAGPEHGWEIDITEDITVAGDSTRLQQVLSNLLANARTHTPSGTVVTTSLVHDGRWAVITVADTGPGIPLESQSEIFERFARADVSRARRTGGTGLGLSIARAIVLAHGGEITVTSVPGDTRFIVRLPAKPADPEI